MLFEDLTEMIIGAAIEVHKELGPGLLENVYSECLTYELHRNNLNFKREVVLPVKYKDKILDCNYRIDFIIEDKVIIELKSVENLLKIHEAQLITYLKLSNIKLGLLINFNTDFLKNGIKRFIL